jgi:epoxyqueuosine reductase
MLPKPSNSQVNLSALKSAISDEARRLGFQQMGICNTDLAEHVNRYQTWLNEGYHAELSYMAQHGSKRWQPDELIDGTLRVLSLRMNYLPDSTETLATLNNPEKGYISRYTLGRDYHKLIRARLKKLIHFIQATALEYDYRAFVDSAPVLERAIAQRAGLGWFGKNTMLINRSAGSWFFLGEIYTNLPLELDAPYEEEHCGSCTACLTDCPTQAFVGPYVLDAKRCISYLTIESKSAIPEELRPLMGNRIFGCDDCQIVCPWTKFSQPTSEQDFSPRHNLASPDLIELFAWDEATFLSKTEGSAIRRTGYEGWIRNIAVALGNAPHDNHIICALKNKLGTLSSLVDEHILWSLKQQKEKQTKI